ncbi:hypothetical protein FO519_007001 [Halicephalobus sp. NKZ332]|nr:hypothetical protein FO519_007001 [Halicephalobus sp. NKZ332]
MAVLSKFFGKVLGFDVVPTNCYENIHVWNPDCKGSLIDITPGGIMFCLKTYTMFYLVSGIFKKGDPRKLNYKKLAKDVVRSSMMLFMNMFYLLYFICWFNHRLGFMTWPTLSFIPSILASFLAILIENPSRRPMLALYLTNLASETLYRQLVNHGYLRFISNGESLVFAAGLTMLTYFYKKYGEKAGEMMKLMKFTHHLDNEKEVFELKKMHPKARLWLNVLRSSFTKHKLCEHKHSCASIILESGMKNFSYGLAASVALTALKSIRSPSNLKNIFSLQTLQLPSFLAALPVIYHSVECGLTRLLNKKSDAISVAAGGLSGGAMLFFPSTSIAMYFLWKGFEMIYFKLAEKGWVPRYKYADVLLYALSTGFVLGNVIIEPHAVRKGYLSFLRGLTGNKLDVFNRRLFTRFGFDSNRIAGVVDEFKKQYPDLLDLTGNEMYELIHHNNEFDQKVLVQTRNLINDCKSILIDESQPIIPFDEKVLPKILFKGVSAKKEAEIRYLTKLVSVECEKSGIKNILDIGCGKGNFMRALHHLGFTVHGFEANLDFIEIGKKETENYPNLAFTHCRLDSSNIQILANTTSDPMAIVSLHGCGDLQRTIIKFFASSANDRIPLLITVPCCYHKRTVISTNSWTMSRTVNQLLHQSGTVIPVSALRLAGDQGFHRFKKATTQEMADHRDSLFHRAIFEEAFPNESCVRHNFQKLKTTEDIPSEFCKIAGVPEEDIESNILKVKAVLEKFENEKETLLKYSILQSIIQPILELLIFIDAALCLSESGKCSIIRESLPLTVTPRNKIIICQALND